MSSFWKNSDEETILGIKIDQKLNFNNYIETILKQVKSCVTFKDIKLSWSKWQKYFIIGQ